jgi:hypothetical protein
MDGLPRHGVDPSWPDHARLAGHKRDEEPSNKGAAADGSKCQTPETEPTLAIDGPGPTIWFQITEAVPKAETVFISTSVDAIDS